MTTDEKIKPVKEVAPPPADLHVVKKEILSNVIKDEKEAIVSINRGQLFVRIPTKIAERLNLKLGDKIKFIVEGEGDKISLNVEIVKG